MIKNLLKASFRHFLRHKLFSSLSIAGLAIGLAAGFAILLYVLNEIHYDSYHTKRKRIFRIIGEDISFDVKSPQTPFILAPTLQQEIPAIEKVSRIKGLIVKVEHNNTFENARYFMSVDPSLFEIFSIELLEGDPKTVLNDPYSVALSEEMANRYFPDNDAINKTISVKIQGELYDLKITGIFKNIPVQSTFKANFICPIFYTKKTLEKRHNLDPYPTQSWTFPSVSTYILVADNTNIKNLQKTLAGFSKIHSREKRPFNFFLQPLDKIYLHSSHLVNNHLPEGNIKNIYFFTTIALSILFMAAVNFILLATAQSTVRIKEIGIRKVLGSSRLALMGQITAESILIALISLPIAVALVEFLLPILNRFLGTKLSLFLNANVSFFLIIISITFLLGGLSGGYISFHLSRLQPTKILNSRMNSGSTKSTFWKVLIGFQLVIFISLVTVSLFIYRQMQYTNNIDMGFNKENLVVIDLPFYEHFKKYGFNNLEAFMSKYESYKNEIKNHPNVINASLAVEIPPGLGWMRAPMHRFDEPEKYVNVDGFAGDYDFVETMGFQILTGRSFSKNDGKGTFLLNETAAEELGIKDLTSYDEKLIGILKDFHPYSLHEKIPPVIISLYTKSATKIVVRVSPKYISDTIQFLKEKWSDFAPNRPFSYKFFDEYVEQLYAADLNFDKMMKFFTFLAVTIACLGLWGLSLFLSDRRTKEIGIRKVFGATMSNIISLLYKEFIVILLISSIISVPIVLYAIGKWLQNFAYHVDINFMTFFLSDIIALLILCITIGFRTVKASGTNPVNILRYE